MKNVSTRWFARSIYQRSKDIKKKDTGYKTVEHNFAGFPSKCPRFKSVFALYDRSKLGVGQSLMALSPACNPPPLTLADAAEQTFWLSNGDQKDFSVFILVYIFLFDTVTAPAEKFLF